MDNFNFVEEQHKALAVFLENQKESNGVASAMPPHQPVAGPSKVVPPPIPYVTRPKMPPPAQVAVIQKLKPKSTALMSMMPGLSNLRAQEAPVQALETLMAWPVPSKLTPQQVPQPALSTSTAWPAPSGPVKKPMVTNTPTKKVVLIKASRPTVACREGSPTDQMVKLTMSEKEDREDIVRVSQPAQHLVLLEDMNVDDLSQGLKRKRNSSRDSEFVMLDGWADDKEKPLRCCAAQ